MEDEVQTTPEVDVSSFTSESSGSTTTTKDAAKIVAHASKTSESIDSVERILPAIKTFDIWDDQSQITPLLTDYISSHPIKQKAVERDVPNYSYTERTLGKLGSLYGKTTKSMELSKRALEIADYRNGGIAAKVAPDLYKIKDDFDLAAKQTEYDNLKEQYKEYTKYDTGEDPITDTATGVLGLLAQIGTAPVRQPKVATAAGVGAAAGTASTGVGVLASLPSGALGAIGGSSIVDNVVTTAGSIYQEAYLDNPRKAFINEKDAYEISLAAGVVSGGIEYVQQVFTFGGSKLLDKVPAAKGLTRKAIVQALRTGKGTAVIATAKALGQAVASSMQEYSQQVVQGVATDIAQGKNEFKPIGERIWIAAGEQATSEAAIQSAAIGAFAPAAVGGTVKGVTAIAKNGYGYFVDINEKLGEAGAVDTGDGTPPSDNGEQPPSEAKPKKEFRFVIQDTEIKKAKQAEATAQFIKDVAETRYTEANPDTVEAVEKSISPEGYGFVHVADMDELTAQDAKLLKKWQSFTGQLAEGTKVVKIANHDIVALQRVNNEVANIYRTTPDATSVRSHAKWLEKLDNNRQKVQDLMTQLDAEQKDVSKLFEGEVQFTDLNDVDAKPLPLEKFGEVKDGTNFTGEISTAHTSKNKNLKFGNPEKLPQEMRNDNVFGNQVAYFDESGFWSSQNKVAPKSRWGPHNFTFATKVKFKKAFVLTPKTLQSFIKIVGEFEKTTDSQRSYSKESQKYLADIPSKLKSAGYDGLIIRGMNEYYKSEWDRIVQKYPAVAPEDSWKSYSEEYEQQIGPFLDELNDTLPLGEAQGGLQDQVLAFNPNTQVTKIERLKDQNPETVRSAITGVTKQLNEAVAQSSENILPDAVEVDQPTKENLRVKYDILTDQLDNAMKKQDSQAIQVAVDNLVEHITKEEAGVIKDSSIFTQLKDLGLNITKSTMKLVRVDAKTVISETKLNQMDPRIFAQNAREYAREANVALTRNDYDAYYEAKRLQLTNIEAIKETQKVKNDLAKLVTTMENVTSYDVQQQLKTLNNNSVEFINDLVSIFNVDPKSGKVRLDNQEYEAFVKDLMARNVPVPTMTDEMFQSTGVDLKSLTPNQINAINTALNSAVLATRKEITLFRKAKEQKLASITERINKLLSNRKDSNPENYERVQSILQERDLGTYKEMMKVYSPKSFIGYGLNALLGNLADIVKYDLDLGENNGYFTQLLYNPLIESANEKSQLINTFNEIVAGFVKFYGIADWVKLENQKVDFFGIQLSKAELIIMTGYLGTDSSRKRLSRWLGQNINDITAELEKHVTAKDAANVQTIINFYETVMLPKERQQSQRMGWTPKNEVPAVPFKFAGKEFNGGYLPLNTIMDDFAKAQRESTSHVERVRSGQVNVDTLTQNQTFDKSELSRDENSALPIDLSLTELKRVFDMRAQAYAFGESVYNVNRILGDPYAQKAIANVLGPQKYFILHDTIQTLSGNRYASDIATEKKAKELLNIITNNAAVAAIGGNFITVLKQGASFPLMVKNLSSSSSSLSATRYLTTVVADILSNPISWYQQAEFIAKFDAEFAAKFRKWNKDNPDFLRLAKSIDPTLDQVEDHNTWMATRGWQSFKALSMAPLAYVSLMLNTIQWTAAYNMAMDGKVKNVPAKTKDAALHATKMVKYSLERNEIFEKSDVQRIAFFKPFIFMTNQLSVVGSYFVNQFNLASRKSAIDPRTTIYQYSKASVNSFLAVALPAMILKLLFGKATEDEETGEITPEYQKLINNPKTWIAKNTGWSLVDSIPVLSSVSYMAQGNLEYGNPVSDVVTGAAGSWKVVSAFFQDEDLSEYKYKDAKYKARKFLTGPLLGVPFRKVQDEMFNYMFSGPSEDQGLKLYNLPDGIPSTDKDEASMYDLAKEGLNTLWDNKNDLVKQDPNVVASIIQELIQNAQTKEEAQVALNALRMTSPRGYLINPEYRQVTVRTKDSERVIQLTKEDDKDLEIYLDTIGRKETRNYQSLKNPDSSARGYMQIVDSTRASLQNLYPEYDIYKNTPTLELPKEVQFDMARKLNMEVYHKIKDLNIQSDDTRYSMWYITGHVLGNSPEGRAVIKAYKDGDLNTKIKDLVPENIISGNPSVFGRLSDDLTLAEVIDRVENGYDNVQGIVDYKKLSEKDYDDGVGAIK